MNIRQSSTEHRPAASPAGSIDPCIEARIDAVLRAYAHAEPAPGLESRVAARLASARPRSRFHFSLTGASAFLLLRRISAGALATAAGAAIVVGTLQHSERGLPPQISRQREASGLKTAGASHIPTRAMPQGGSLNPSAPRVAPHGRAVVSRDQARHASGSAVPRSPYAPGQEPAASANPRQ